MGHLACGSLPQKKNAQGSFFRAHVFGAQLIQVGCFNLGNCCSLRLLYMGRIYAPEILVHGFERFLVESSRIEQREPRILVADAQLQLLFTLLSHHRAECGCLVLRDTC